MRNRRMLRCLGVVAAVVALGCLTAPVAGADSGGAPVLVTFQGSGQYNVDESYNYGGQECSTHDVWTLSWTSTFQSTIVNGALTSASGAYTTGTPGTADMTFGGLCAEDPSVTPPCYSNLSTPSAQPNLTVGDSSPQRIEAQSIASDISASCDPADAGFIGRDEAVFNAVVPDSMTGVTNVPASGLGASFPVSSSGAPSQVAANCTGVGPNPDGTLTSCNASLTWNGTITINCADGNAPATVTMSDEAALPVGTKLCVGESVKTGPDSRLDLTFDDGSVVRVGPNSEAQIETPTPSQPQGIQVKLILGVIWAKVSIALGANLKFEVDTERAMAVGVRGAADVSGHAAAARVLAAGEAGGGELTASVDPSTGGLTLHVIRGTGFYMTGTAEHDFPAGYTLTDNGNMDRLSTNWSAADQALVPAGYMPPQLSRLKFVGRNLGPKTHLRLTLSQPATVSVQVLKRDRVVAQFRKSGHAGRNTLTLRHGALRKGTYTLLVGATSSAQRVSLAELVLRAR